MHAVCIAFITGKPSDDDPGTPHRNCHQLFVFYEAAWPPIRENSTIPFHSSDSVPLSLCSMKRISIPPSRPAVQTPGSRSAALSECQLFNDISIYLHAVIINMREEKRVRIKRPGAAFSSRRSFFNGTPNRLRPRCYFIIFNTRRVCLYSQLARVCVRALVIGQISPFIFSNARSFVTPTGGRAREPDENTLALLY